jgi:hypothetical protein
MRSNLMRRLGRMCLFPLASLVLLTACAGKPIVRTETVTVHTPVYVPLPSDLLTVCTVTAPEVWTNGSLLDYALQIKACLNATNDKLMRIRALQPRTTP